MFAYHKESHWLDTHPNLWFPETILQFLAMEGPLVLQKGSPWHSTSLHSLETCSISEQFCHRQSKASHLVPGPDTHVRGSHCRSTSSSSSCQRRGKHVSLGESVLSSLLWPNLAFENQAWGIFAPKSQGQRTFRQDNPAFQHGSLESMGERWSLTNMIAFCIFLCASKAQVLKQGQRNPLQPLFFTQ